MKKKILNYPPFVRVTRLSWWCKENYGVWWLDLPKEALGLTIQYICSSFFIVKLFNLVWVCFVVGLLYCYITNKFWKVGSCTLSSPIKYFYTNLTLWRYVLYLNTPVAKLGHLTVLLTYTCNIYHLSYRLKFKCHKRAIVYTTIFWMIVTAYCCKTKLYNTQRTKLPKS